jgi:hypothetical protein
MKPLKWTAIVLLPALSVGAGFLAGRNFRPPPSYLREMALSIQAMAKAPGPFIAVIGDSLTERAKLPATVCGIQLVNAGFGGSRASNFIPFAEEMTALDLVPALVVIALGLNDARRGYRTDFRSTYRLLLETLPESPVVLATLAPVDRAFDTGAILDPSRLSMVDLTIREIAKARNLPLIDLSDVQSPTSDGVHPIDYGSWSAAMVAGIEREFCRRAR